jgi:3-hydroxyisobutyrate dehydrogenase-like beta-hydroxyacid dehydrogenase
LKKQIAVIGLGRFGASLVATLHEAGHEVLAIDNDEKRVQELWSPWGLTLKAAFSAPYSSGSWE